MTSPIDGVFYEINNGRIIIQRRTDWLELRAMVPGNVVNYIADRGVVIETKGCLIQGVWGSGKESFGKLKIATRTGDTALSTGQIMQAEAGQILVAGRVERLDVLEKAIEAEIYGVIAGSMSAELCQLSDQFPFPIILTDGVGSFGMSPAVFAQLQDLEGKDASIFGIYEPAIGERPEIIIPQEADKPSGNATPLYKPLAVGETVRILRDPYIGQIGEVVKVYKHSKTTAINIKSHGADVKLADESVVFIPGNNLEILL